MPAALLVLVLALSAVPARAVSLDDSVFLLQAELEKAKAPKATVPDLDEDDTPVEPICQQLAGKGGSCEPLVHKEEPIDLFAAAPEVNLEAKLEEKKALATEEVDQPPARPAKSAGSSALGYVLDVLVVVLVLDGIRRWRQGKAEEAEADSEPESWDDLMKAALAGDVSRCEALLAKEANVTGSDLWGCTLLHAASKGGALPVVRSLLNRGAKADELDSWDETPLHLAARAGHKAVCELLLSRGAPIDAANAQDWTPLVVAADAGHEAVCRMLINQEASVGGLDEEMLPALLVSLLAEMAQQREAEVEEEAEFKRRAEEEYWEREAAGEGDRQ